MARRTLALALVALTLVTAGCLTPDSLSGDDPEPAPGPGDGTEDGGAGADDGSDEPDGFGTPSFSPGLWWRYDVEGLGSAGGVTFAVQAVDGDTYTILANGTDHAAVDAVRDLAYVGPVRADDLAGLVDGEPVRFFEWPLRDGRTWTTTWNGTERTHEAREATLEVPGGTLPGVEITSSAGGEVLATYTYAPAVGWFTRLELPKRGVSYELQDVGFAYDGNLSRAEATPAFEAASPAVAADGFDVPEEADRVALSVEGGGDQLSYDVNLVDANGTRHQVGPRTCDACQVDALDLLPAVPGSWSAEANLASDPPGNLTASAAVVDAQPVTVDYGS